MRWISTTRGQLIDAVLIAMAAAEAWVAVVADDTISRRTLIFAAAAILSLCFRKRAPYVVFALVLPALITSEVVVAAQIALFTVAERRPGRWPLMICAAAFFIGYTRLWEKQYDGFFTVLTVVYAVIFTVAPVLLGLLIRARADLSHKLAEIERVRRHEEELLVERALAQERAELAREMHDVVSHQVSLIAVQAGALQITAPDAICAEGARTIRTLSVKTLDELREMVGVLRPSGNHTMALAPQPGIEELDALAASSGIRTTVNTVSRAASAPSPAVQRAIYRAAQEGLTNVAKHAPGASASLELCIENGEVTLTLTNTTPTGEPDRLPSDHHGLLGLRERAELLGGSLRAGHRSDGGYELKMTLPTHV